MLVIFFWFIVDFFLKVMLDWKLEDDARALGTLTIKEFFSDFPEDLELSVSIKVVYFLLDFQSYIFSGGPRIVSESIKII